MVCVVVGWIIGSEGKVESFRYCFVSIVFCFLERKKNQKKNTISKLQKLLKKSELFLLFHIYSQSENIKSQLHTYNIQKELQQFMQLDNDNSP